MSYYSIRDGAIYRHVRREGRDIETKLETLTVKCLACQWEVKSLRARDLPELCICGGRLQVVASNRAVIEVPS